jgi:hypothetical protein
VMDEFAKAWILKKKEGETERERMMKVQW